MVSTGRSNLITGYPPVRISRIAPNCFIAINIYVPPVPTAGVRLTNGTHNFVWPAGAYPAAAVNRISSNTPFKKYYYYEIATLGCASLAMTTLTRLQKSYSSSQYQTNNRRKSSYLNEQTSFDTILSQHILL
jgi:hypothetical protein